MTRRHVAYCSSLAYFQEINSVFRFVCGGLPLLLKTRVFFPEKKTFRKAFLVRLGGQNNDGFFGGEVFFHGFVEQKMSSFEIWRSVSTA